MKIKPSNKLIIVVIGLVIVASVVGYNLLDLQPTDVVWCTSTDTSDLIEWGIGESFTIPDDVVSLGPTVRMSIAWSAGSGGNAIVGLSKVLSEDPDDWETYGYDIFNTAGYHTTTVGTVPCDEGDLWYLMVVPLAGYSTRWRHHHSVENCGSPYPHVQNAHWRKDYVPPTWVTKTTWDWNFKVTGMIDLTGTLPDADFTYSVSGLTVNTDASPSNQADQYRWKWQTGGTWSGWSSSPTATHTYGSSGTYSVTLEAQNSYGTDEKTKDVLVGGGGSPPNALFTYNKNGLTVAFNDDSTGTPTAWSWNLGDGQTSTLQNPTHQYGSSGTYTVTLTASNSYGDDTYTDFVTVDSEQTFTLTVYTKDSNSVLLPDATVDLDGDVQNSGPTGTVVYGGLGSGLYTLSVSKAGYQTWIKPDGVAISENTVVTSANLIEGGTITYQVTVYDKSYNHITGASVTLTGANTYGPVYTGTGGLATFNNVEIGTYDIEVEYQGATFTEEDVNINTNDIYPIVLGGDNGGFELDLVALLVSIIVLAIFIILAAIPFFPLGLRVAFVIVGIVLALLIYVFMSGLISIGIG